MRSRAFALVLCGALAACSGGGSAPPSAPAQRGPLTTASVTIHFTPVMRAASAKRIPQFVDPGGASLSVVLDNGSASFTSVAPDGSGNQTITFSAYSGSHTIAITEHSANGNLLAEGYTQAYVSAGSSSGFALTLNLVVGGIALINTDGTSHVYAAQTLASGSSANFCYSTGVYSIYPTDALGNYVATNNTLYGLIPSITITPSGILTAYQGGLYNYSNVNASTTITATTSDPNFGSTTYSLTLTAGAVCSG